MSETLQTIQTLSRKHIVSERELKATTMEHIHSGAIPQKDICHIPIRYLDFTNIPNVPKENILTAGKAYKPFRYEYGYTMWQVQNQVQWLPEEVVMTEDVRDWKSKLTDAERNLMTNIAPLFTQNDILVNNVYTHQYARLFLPNEIQMGISAIANIEATHVAAYAHLLDSLNFPESTYSVFMDIKEMSDKYDYTAGFKTDTLLGIAIALVVFGGMTEGVQLFGTFSIMLNFSRFNKLKGVGQIVAWSCRDEEMHVSFVSKIHNSFMSEYGHLIDMDLYRDAVYRATRAIVEYECLFADKAFELGDIEGISLKDHKTYIHGIADKRLEQFGLEPLFGKPTNPYKWIDQLLGGPELANLFESRGSQYSRAATTGSWEEAWSGYDNSV